jgi:hypothetical protein
MARGIIINVTYLLNQTEEGGGAGGTVLDGAGGTG